MRSGTGKPSIRAHRADRERRPGRLRDARPHGLHQGLPGDRSHPAPIAATWHAATELPRCIVLDLDAGGIGTSLKVLDTIRSHDDLRVSSTRWCSPRASPKNR